MTESDTTTRHLEYMRIDALVPAEDNPKRHDLEALRASFTRFGFTVPALIDERTGRLVAGHGRVQLLQYDMKEGKTRPQGITTDPETGVWLMPVLRGWSSKDDAEANAYLIADNRQTELGGWHEDSLAPMLAELAKLDTGLTGIGFDPNDLTDMLKRMEGPPSLDDLAAQHGPPELQDMWPSLSFKVAPAVRERWMVLSKAHGDDADLFARMVDTWEAAQS